MSAVDIPAIEAPWQVTYRPEQAARMLGISVAKLFELRQQKLPDGTPLIASVKTGHSRNATTLIPHAELVALPARLRQLYGEQS